MYFDDCVCVLSDLTRLPRLRGERKSWYIIIIILCFACVLQTVEEDHARLLSRQEELKTKIESAEQAEAKCNQEALVYAER